MKKLAVILLLLLVPILAGITLVGTQSNTSKPFPIVTTNAATSITGSGATLNGTAYNYNSAGTSFFNYGLTSAYGSKTSSTAFAGNTSSTAFTGTVSGLSIGVTYHFQACVSNSAGMACGGDLTFVPAGLSLVTTFTSGTTSPNATAIDIANQALYVSGEGSTPGSIIIDSVGSKVYVTPVGNPTHITVKKIDLVSMTVTNTDSFTPSGVYAYRYNLDLSGRAAATQANATNQTFTFVGSGFIESSVGTVNCHILENVIPNLNNENCILNLGAGITFVGGLYSITTNRFYQQTVSVVYKNQGSATDTHTSLSDTGSWQTSITADTSNVYVANNTKLDKFSLTTLALTTSTTFNETSPSTVNPGATKYCTNGTTYVFCVRENFVNPTYNPSWVTLITKSTMVEGTPVVLNTGEVLIYSGAIDTTNKFIYLTSFSSGNISKLLYAD